MPRQTISEVLTQIRSQAGDRAAQAQYVANWRSQIPAWSRWEPGYDGRPDCLQCKGLGYLRLDLPSGHPLFGKFVTCECAADTMQRELARELLGRSDLAETDLGLRWSDVRLHAGNRQAVAETQATLRRGYGWVYLHGAPGPGKTLVLKTAVAEALTAGKAAVFANWADILDHLRGGYDSGDYDERLAKWRQVPLLVIDEFGRAKESEWVHEAEGKLLNFRYELAVVHHKGVTLFGSNYPPDRFDDWLLSRFRDGRNVIAEIGGDDVRPAMEYDA